MHANYATKNARQSDPLDIRLCVPTMLLRLLNTVSAAVFIIHYILTIVCYGKRAIVRSTRRLHIPTVLRGTLDVALLSTVSDHSTQYAADDARQSDGD